MTRTLRSMKAWVMVLGAALSAGVGAAANPEVGWISDDLARWIIGVIGVLTTAVIGGTAYEDARRQPRQG